MPTRNAEVEALKAVLERVRAAKGSDQEIDARVWAECDGRDVVHRPAAFVGNCYCGRSRRDPHDECVLWIVRAQGVACEYYVPRLTASIDAAVALVERVLPGADYEIRRVAGRTFGKVRFALLTSVEEECATEALSLLAALLSAKLALTQEAAHEHG